MKRDHLTGQLEYAFDMGRSWAEANYPAKQEHFDQAVGDFSRLYGPRVAGHFRQAIILILRIKKEKASA